MSKTKQLARAVRHFVDAEMRRHTADMPNYTEVKLEIPGRNGYVLNLNLFMLRWLWEAYDALVAEKGWDFEEEHK